MQAARSAENGLTMDWAPQLQPSLASAMDLYCVINTMNRMNDRGWSPSALDRLVFKPLRAAGVHELHDIMELGNGDEKFMPTPAQFGQRRPLERLTMPGLRCCLRRTCFAARPDACWRPHSHGC